MELDPRASAGEYQQNQLKPYRISMNFIETWRDVHGEREKGLPAAAQTAMALMRSPLAHMVGALALICATLTVICAALAHKVDA